MYRSSALMKIKSLFEGGCLFVCLLFSTFKWKHRMYLKTRTFFFFFCIVLSTQSMNLGLGSTSFIFITLDISVSTHSGPWLHARGITHLSFVLHVTWLLMQSQGACERQLRQDSVLWYPFSQLWARAQVKLWVSFLRSPLPKPHQTFCSTWVPLTDSALGF